MKNPIQEIRSNDNINSPVRIALVYFAISTLWILLSEPLIARLVTDPLTPNLANAVQDWIFIVITTALLYWLIRHDRATLQASERRFRTLIEHSADAISLADQDGKLLYVSPAYSHIMGYTADEVVGHNVYGHLHPDERGPMQARIAAVLSQPGKSFNSEVRQRHKDGRWLWLEGTATNLINEPEIGAIVVNFRDITERKQAGDLLHESEERYRGLFEHMMEGFAYCQMLFENDQPVDWIYLNVNASFEGLTGLKGANGRRVTELIPGIREADPTLFTTYGRVARGGQPERLEVFVNTMQMWFSVSVYCPKEGFFVAVFDVITERKRAEDQLRYHAMVLNQISDAVIATDLTFHITSWNQGAEELYGFTSTEVLGRRIDEVIYRDPPANQMESAQQLFQDGIWTGEAIQNRKDGTVIVVQASVTLIKDHIGQTIGVVAVNRDITETKLAESKLREAEHFAQVTIDSLSAHLCVLAEDGTILNVNKAWRDFAEANPPVPPDYCVGANYLTVCNNTSGPYSAEAAPMAAGIRAMLKGETEYFSLEYPCHAPWEKRWFIARVTRFIENNHLRLVVTHENITGRKQAELALRDSEERYRTLAEAATDSIFVITPDDTIQYVNEAASRFLGQPASALIGQKRATLFSADTAYEQNSFMQDVLETGQPRRAEMIIPTPQGSNIWLDTSLVPLRNYAGEIEAVLGIARDITFHKHAEESVKILNAQLEQQLKRLTSLREIDLVITASLDLKMTLQLFLQHVLEQLQVEAAAVLLLHPATQSLHYAAGLGFRGTYIRTTNLKIGTGLAGQVALERQPLLVSDVKDSQTSLARAGLFVSEDFQAYCGYPLIAKGQLKGVLEVFRRSPLKVKEDWLDFLEALGRQAAIAIDNAQLFDHLQRSNSELTLAYDATIEGWSRALDLRDKETEGHSQRVTELTVRLAQIMSVSDATLVHIRRGALLHDIGKLGIPDNILLKPGPLTDAEWEIMRKHPQFAYDLLIPITYLRQALEIPYSHHEKWDGSGYPQGLKGTQIPLAARIFAVADVYDALRADRPYRAGWSEEKVRAHIAAESGQHFDPAVVAAFMTI